MNASPIEEQVRRLLLERKYRELTLLGKGDRRVWRSMQSQLYQVDEALRWHAIEAVAVFVRQWWDSGRHEKALDYMRRLMWSINDESGGIGWSTPQTIAEIVVAIPQLADPFVSNMIAVAFHEPALMKSGLYAVGRLGPLARRPMEPFRDDVLACFDADDPETLGLAVWATGKIGMRSALPHLTALENRVEAVRIYLTPCFHERPLGEWARLAVARIQRWQNPGPG